MAAHIRRLLVALLIGAAGSGLQAGDLPRVTVNPGDSWRFAATPPASQEALARAWGQFELLLPRQGFVLPAPRCKGDIRLRWIALVPETPRRDERLAARWALLQQLQALLAGQAGAEPVSIALDLRAYTRREADGGVSLTGCNAFTDEP